MFTNFSQAQLAIVAYAEVSGTDGSSTKTNSGIATTRLGLGTYALDLPVASQNQIGLQQFSDRDLIFVQPLNASAPLAVERGQRRGTRPASSCSSARRRRRPWTRTSRSSSCAP